MNRVNYIVIGALLAVNISLVVACTVASPPVPLQDIYILTRESAPSLVTRN